MDDAGYYNIRGLHVERRGGVKEAWPLNLDDSWALSPDAIQREVGL